MASFEVYWREGKKGFTARDAAAQEILDGYRAIMIGLAANPGPGAVVEKALERDLLNPEQLGELLAADWWTGTTQNEQPNLGVLTRIISDAIKAGLRVGEERGRSETRAARRRVEQSRPNPLRPV